MTQVSRGCGEPTIVPTIVGFCLSKRKHRDLRAVQARRRLLVLLFYSAIISLFVLFGVLIIPDVVRVPCRLPCVAQRIHGVVRRAWLSCLVLVCMLPCEESSLQWG